MKDLAPPTNRQELQRFLGLCGYYRRFLAAYAELVQPLSDLLKQSSSWNWGPMQQTAFARVKGMLQRSPVLQLPDFGRQFFVTTDASDIAVGGVLSQVHSSGDHPVAYLSRKLSETERRWPAHEKELYAIKLCLEKWRAFLGAKFVIYTDSMACKWFFTKKQPLPKLLRWMDTFSQYQFEIFHRAGRTNVVADALSRPVEIHALLVTTPDPALAARIKALYTVDPDCQQILERLHSSPRSESKYILENGLIVVQNGQGKQVVLPRDDRLILDVLVQYHDEATTAHPGAARTYLAVRQDFIWPGLRTTVEDYVRTCETCMRNNLVNARRGCCSRCLSQRLRGWIYRWTWLRGCQCQAATMQFVLLYVVSASVLVIFRPARQRMRQNWLECFSTKSWSFMVFRGRLYRIGIRNSSVNFGKLSWRRLRSSYV